MQNRKILYQILNQTPLQLLLQIPDGYRNNIYWNVAHVVATQQLLVYDRSNLQMKVPDTIIAKYRKGTFPDGSETAEDLKELSACLLKAVEFTAADYSANVFKEYNGFTTATKTLIQSVEDAMVFNLFHEGLHLGVVLSLQKGIIRSRVS